MKKPIYLYVTPFFPSPKSWRGGYCYDAVKALMLTGRYDVRVLLPGTGPDYEYNGVKVARFRVRHLPCGLAPFVFARFNKRAFLSKINLLGIDWRDVAVCHVHTMQCAIYCEAAKRCSPNTKVLLQHHCSGPVRLQSGRLGVVPIHATLLYLYYRRLCASVDAQVFVSKKSQETFGKFFKGAPEDPWHDIRESLWFGRWLKSLPCRKAIVAYNGVDDAVFNEQGRKPHAGFVIGCVANFQPLKDHMTLLRAFTEVVRQIPDAKLRLVGSGETLDECIRFAEKNCPAGTVSFEKEVDHLALPEFYRSLDLFVLPSRLEGFCCSYMEAVGCGTPVMGCRGVSLEEVIPEGDRANWLVAPCDSHELAKKIIAYYAEHKDFKLTQSMRIGNLAARFLDDVAALDTKFDNLTRGLIDC